MCKDCCCNDDREAENDLAVAEAKGQFHSVTVEVTIQTTIDLAGKDHTTDELEEAVQEVIDNEIIKIEEV